MKDAFNSIIDLGIRPVYWMSECYLALFQGHAPDSPEYKENSIF